MFADVYFCCPHGTKSLAGSIFLRTKPVYFVPYLFLFVYHYSISLYIFVVQDLKSVCVCVCVDARVFQADSKVVKEIKESVRKRKSDRERNTWNVLSVCIKYVS